jgi:hypothetical protein
VPTPRLKPNPENCSLAELELAIAATPRKKDSMRLLAIKALLLDDNRIFVSRAIA